MKRREKELPPKRDWGALLTGVRTTQGLSQAAMALRLGTTQQVISGIENARDPHASTVERYLRALGWELRAFRIAEPMGTSKRLGDIGPRTKAATTPARNKSPTKAPRKEKRS